MKILILTISLGQGHNSVANCIAKQLNLMGQENIIIDMYEYISPLLKEIMSRGYLFTMDSAAKLRPLAKEVYHLNENRQIDSDELSISSIIKHFQASELRKFIDHYRPDVIICTQVYTAQVVALLKGSGCTNAFSIGIVTDFTIQTYWQDTLELDFIVTATSQLEYQLKQRGIPPQKMLPFGIPIDSKFKTKMPTAAARRSLGLSESLPTMLIMGGSMGFGKIDDEIQELDMLDFDFQCMVVCGSNNKLFNKLTSIKSAHCFQIYSYTNQIDMMMSASDLIITKPGGVTTSEALVMGLPIIIVNPIPGMEERNTEFLCATGAAINVTKTFTLAEAVSLVLHYPQNKQRLSQAALSLSQPDSTLTLCSFIEKQLTQVIDYPQPQ